MSKSVETCDEKYLPFEENECIILLISLMYQKSSESKSEYLKDICSYIILIFLNQAFQPINQKR